MNTTMQDLPIPLLEATKARNLQWELGRKEFSFFLPLSGYVVEIRPGDPGQLQFSLLTSRGHLVISISSMDMQEKEKRALRDLFDHLRETLLNPRAALAEVMRAITSDLKILAAQYGADDLFADVTTRLQTRIRMGSLRIQASNFEMGIDPAPGRGKKLLVRYYFGGEEHSEEVLEGQILSIP